VRTAAALAAWLTAADDGSPVDLVIANAGIGGGTGAETRTIVEVNLLGTIATVEPLLPRMLGRRRGTIALMGSLAAYRGYAQAPAYAASKAAVRVWGQGLRARLAGSGVRVCVISPGFVDTALTRRNRFPMPLLVDADTAARRIVRGLDTGRGEIAFPWPLVWAARLLAVLPAGVAERLTRGLPAKEGI
jgi:short-subunit dehydrogenase